MVRRARGMRPKQRCLYVTAQRCGNDMEKRVMLKQFNSKSANRSLARLHYDATALMLEDIVFI